MQTRKAVLSLLKIKLRLLYFWRKVSLLKNLQGAKFTIQFNLLHILQMKDLGGIEMVDPRKLNHLHFIT